MRRCNECGTVFDRPFIGEVGRIESIRWVPWNPRKITRLEQFRWWLAGYLADLTAWVRGR